MEIPRSVITGRPIHRNPQLLVRPLRGQASSIRSQLATILIYPMSSSTATPSTSGADRCRSPSARPPVLHGVTGWCQGTAAARPKGRGDRPRLRASAEDAAAPAPWAPGNPSPRQLTAVTAVRRLAASPRRRSSCASANTYLDRDGGNWPANRWADERAVEDHSCPFAAALGAGAGSPRQSNPDLAKDLSDSQAGRSFPLFSINLATAGVWA